MLYKIAHNTLVLGEQRLPFVRLVHDLPDEAHLKSDLVLEGYFNDIYKLFLRKLVDFEYCSKIEPAKTETMKSLLTELVRIKEFLVHGRSVGNVSGTGEGDGDGASSTTAAMGNPFSVVPDNGQNGLAANDHK